MLSNIPTSKTLTRWSSEIFFCMAQSYLRRQLATPKYALGMHKVAILGSTGLLGSGLTKFFSENQISVIEFNRFGTSHLPQLRGERINVMTFNPVKFLHSLQGVETVINCIGVIKHRINNDSSASREEATLINSHFPNVIDRLGSENNFQVIQIGTDCVYSGSDGNYDENSLKNATDLYGLSKIAGETELQNTLLLRSSFIGREVKTKVEFLEWILGHDKTERVTGYTNHFWNGLTVLQIARIISGIIKSGSCQPGLQHLVPKNSLSKYELASQIATEFGRGDLVVEPTLAQEAINRTLSTANKARNERLWTEAGYPVAPTIKEMVKEYAKWTGNNLNESTCKY